jgi:hypothetical protein
MLDRGPIYIVRFTMQAASVHMVADGHGDKLRW